MMESDVSQEQDKRLWAFQEKVTIVEGGGDWKEGQNKGAGGPAATEEEHQNAPQERDVASHLMQEYHQWKEAKLVAQTSKLQLVEEARDTNHASVKETDRESHTEAEGPGTYIPESRHSSRGANRERSR